MQPLEIALFGVVVALALGLIGTLAWPLWRRRRAGAETVVPASVAGAARPPAGGGAVATPGAQSLVCPACHREFAPGLQFCPHDARDLVPARELAVRAATPGVTCPSCKRSFESGKKFCAFDGEELMPLPVAIGTAGGDVGSAPFAGSLGKICPSCSRRYESDATFCGRDGAELVSVN